MSNPVVLEKSQKDSGKAWPGYQSMFRSGRVTCLVPIRYNNQQGIKIKYDYHSVSRRA